MPDTETVSTATASKRVAKAPPKSTTAPLKKPSKKEQPATTVKAESKKDNVIAKEQPATIVKAEPKKDNVVDKEKLRKPKLVRDSFTMPEDEYIVLGDVKKACLKAGVAVKKSELLRVGVSLMRGLDIETLKGLVSALPALKAGRPKKNK